MGLHEGNSRGILDGLLVVDLSTMIAGPYCASLLGDLGAQVVKVECPKGGDILRSMGAFVNGESTLFVYPESVAHNVRFSLCSQNWLLPIDFWFPIRESYPLFGKQQGVVRIYHVKNTEYELIAKVTIRPNLQSSAHDVFGCPGP